MCLRNCESRSERRSACFYILSYGHLKKSAYALFDFRKCSRICGCNYKMSLLREMGRHRSVLGVVSYGIPRQATKCRTYRATNLPAIRYVHTAAYVWEEHAWISAIGADRNLPSLGSRNGKAFACFLPFAWENSAYGTYQSVKLME